MASESQIPADIIFQITQASFKNIRKALASANFKIGIDPNSFKGAMQKALKGGKIPVKVDEKILRRSIDDVLKKNRKINVTVNQGMLIGSIEKVLKTPRKLNITVDTGMLNTAINNMVSMAKGTIATVGND